MVNIERHIPPHLQKLENVFQELKIAAGVVDDTPSKRTGTKLLLSDQRVLTPEEAAEELRSMGISP